MKMDERNGFGDLGFSQVQENFGFYPESDALPSGT